MMQSYFLCWKKWSFSILILLIFSCTTKVVADENRPIKIFEKVYFDNSRNREIPVTFFAPNQFQHGAFPVIIFSHGYGFNQPGSNRDYDFLLKSLATQGYFVASVQHELPTDDLLPLEGKPQIVRRSNWERGAQNISFVLQELKSQFPKLNYEKLIISGHSDGGDMSVLFADQYPEKIWKLITLDQRRYPFPLVEKPRIYSIRSSDQPADDGVLPSLEDQKNIK